MKKTKFRRGLEKLLVTGLLAGALSSPLDAQKTPAEIAGDSYSQPNMHVSLGRNVLDYYGSGDVNNDEVIDFEDANSIRTENNIGNDRADVNGDGIVSISDATLLENYLFGSISHLPSDWNHLNKPEKIDWFTKMISIDKTDLKQYVSGEYDCTSFSLEHLINFFGVDSLENWINYEQFSEDGDQNARFNIPVYMVSTKVTSTSSQNTEPGGHRIIGVLVGPESGERYSAVSTTFEDWYFVEPQNDLHVQPGDGSINPNEPVDIIWFGYYPDYDLFNPKNMIGFNLENGEATEITFQSSYLLTTDPNAPDTIAPTATFAEDKTVSYPANLETIIQESQPTNVSDNKDPSPVVSHTYDSTQTSEGICSDVSYDVRITWKVEDESGNDTTHIQNLYVRDNEAPSFTTPYDVTIKEGESIDPDSIGKPTDFYDNSGLPVDTSYTDAIESENDLEKVLRRTWTATDVCSNEFSQDQYITIQKPDGINSFNYSEEGIEKIYPIPTGDNLSLEYNLSNSGKVYTEIYDVSGKLMEYAIDEGFTGENKLDLDVSDLKPGMYLLNFTQDEKTYTEKFIKR